MRYWLVLLLVGCSRTELKPLPKVVEEAPTPPSASVIPIIEAPKVQNVLGEFQTLYEFNGKYEGRAKNIQHVADKLDGKELGLGEEFSFNQVVGPRTKENGFFEAPEIFFGEMVSGVGGGTCQVSSTLFAAALLADLEVVQRRSHSRPLKYIGLGLDATVAFSSEDVCKKDPNNCSDLRIRNPYPFPVRLSAEVTSEGEKRKILFRVFGAGSKPEVKARWSQYQTSPFKQRVRKTGKFLGKYKKRLQVGSEGLTGALIVRGGRSSPKLFHSRYAPVDELWEVGLGWDMSQVPWAMTASVVSE
jgi:vancomycin resistance protein YoaR